MFLVINLFLSKSALVSEHLRYIHIKVTNSLTYAEPLYFIICFNNNYSSPTSEGQQPVLGVVITKCQIIYAKILS